MSTKLTENKVRSDFQKAVKKAKERKKKVGCAYEDGMYLCVQASGKAGWHLKYTFGAGENSRYKEISLLVSYPRDNSLQIARQRRAEAKNQLEDGQDPSSVRKSKRAEGADTLMVIAEDFFATNTDVEEDTLTANRKRLENYIFPSLGRTPIRSIKALELRDVLRRIVQGGKKAETARRCCSLCSRIWSHAVLQGQADSNIAAGMHRLLVKVSKKNFAAIVKPKEFGELLRKIDGYEGQALTRLALKLMALVFVRSSELRGAEWSEFDLDAEYPMWLIPAERMKMDKAHIVPLAPQSIAILKDIEIHSGGGRLLFPSLRGADRPMSENTLNGALRSMEYDGQTHVVHGFRSSFSTMVKDRLNWNKALVEVQLAHGDPDKVAEAYERGEYQKQRMKMMCEWATYLDSLRAGGNVLQFKRTA
jgi:integrase